MTPLDDEERYLREMLALLQESYAKAAKPYVDRLVELYSRRSPAPIIVTLDQARQMGVDINLTPPS